MTRYSFDIEIWVTEEWDQAHASSHEVTAKHFASIIRNELARIAPTVDSLTKVTLAGWAEHTPLPQPSPDAPVYNGGTERANAFRPWGNAPTEPAPAAAYQGDPELSTSTELAPIAQGRDVTTGETPRGALEKPIEISARFSHHHDIDVHSRPQPKTRHARCGNCGARLALTDDPTENHHIAMRHKLTCGQPNAGVWSHEEYAAQLQAFNEQPHVIQLKKQYAADTERMALERANLKALPEGATNPVPDKLQGYALAPWWKRIWRWMLDRS